MVYAWRRKGNATNGYQAGLGLCQDRSADSLIQYYRADVDDPMVASSEHLVI
jgi:hypothetical protein